MMCRRVALRSSLRMTLVLLIVVALLPAPFVSMLVAAMGQGQRRGPQTAPPPRPGKPEGPGPWQFASRDRDRAGREPGSSDLSCVLLWARHQQMRGLSLKRLDRYREAHAGPA